MTTIAYRSGIMVSDSCYSHGGTVDTLLSKIYRLKSGALLGQSGENDAREFIDLLNNVKSERGLPTRKVLIEIRADFLGLLVLRTGSIYKINTSIVSVGNWAKSDDNDIADIGVWKISRTFAAIGAGSDFAMGAMAHGATAEQAVAIACRFDTASRPPLHRASL